MDRKIDVGCYYFPNYHPNDARNAAVHGSGWSEWELVKAARPGFPATASLSSRSGGIPTNPARR